MQHRYRVRLHLIALGFALTLGSAAQAVDTDSVEGAIEIAEQYIRNGQYDMPRPCPEGLLYLEAQDFSDEQPPCQHYTASEATAFAVQSSDAVWRVFFRKIVAVDGEQGESFRIIEVLRNDSPQQPRVVLKDIELFLPANATLLDW